MYCTSSTSPGYSIGSPPAILNSATSAPAMQLSTIFFQSSTGSVSFVPNFEKHCRHLKLHASKIWRLILYFFFNVSFLFFCFLKWPADLAGLFFSIDIVHIFDKILHMFPVRDIFTVITYCWKFDFCRKYFAIFGFSAIAVFFLFLLQQRNYE